MTFTARLRQGPSSPAMPSMCPSMGLLLGRGRAVNGRTASDNHGQSRPSSLQLSTPIHPTTAGWRRSKGGMLTLLARGGLPGLRVGLEHARGALLDGGETRGLACCCDAGRSRLAAAVAVAGAAVPPSRSCQVPAPSVPRRQHSTAACEPSSAVRRSRPRPARCAAARPARAQLGDAGRSWAWRLQRSPRHRAGAALAGQRVVRTSQQATERRLRGATMARYCCWWHRRVPGDM
jgi:hypothetical protein